MITVNPNTRQFNIPGTDLVFGVEDDSGSVIKQFQVPRYVGNDLDLTGCFIRMNYRNANGEIDTYLVQDVAVEGDNIVFGWELSPKVTMYKGNVSFVMCVVGPDTKVKWHTTLGRGQVLEGLEPDSAMIEEGTADVVAALIAMVEAQTAAVEDTGAEWVQNVQSEGTDQIIAVQTAGAEAKAAAVAEIEAKGVNTLASIPEDYTSLESTVDTLNRTRGAAIVCEAAGESVVVSDSSNLPMQGLRVFGRSTQDGVPSPEAPVEIVSVESPVVTVGGKNLLPPTTGTISAQGITSSPTDTGTVLLDGTATQEISRVVSQNFLLSPGKYTLSVTGIHTVDGNKDRVYMNAADGSGTIVNYVMVDKPMTFEMASSAIVRVAIVFAPDSTYDNEVAYIQLESGDTATAYEPYKALQTIETTYPLRGIPVTTGGNYTDANGQQWICDEIDLERGVLVRRIATKTLTEADVVYVATGYFEFGTYAYTTIRDAREAPSDVVVISDEMFGIAADQRSGSEHDDKYRCYGQSGVIYVRFPAGTGEKTLAECKEAFAGATIQYALATPIETTLSETEIAAYRALHSNYPNTTVLNSAGAHMVVKYAADTKLYIDNKIAALMGG